MPSRGNTGKRSRFIDVPCTYGSRRWGQNIRIRQRPSMVLRGFGMHKVRARRRELGIPVRWQFVSRRLEHIILIQRRFVHTSLPCSTRWANMSKQPNLKQVNWNHELSAELTIVSSQKL